MSWISFVAKTINEVNEQSIPDYFGELKKLLLQTQHNYSFQAPVDEDPLLSLNLVPQQQENKNDVSLITFDNKDETDSETEWNKSAVNDGWEEPSVIEKKESKTTKELSKVIEERDPEDVLRRFMERIVLRMRNSSPSSQTYINRIKQGDSKAIEDYDRYLKTGERLIGNGYATDFATIADTVYSHYWPPIDTKIPRITPNSKIFVKFSKAKYPKYIKGMETKFNEPVTNKLRFQRV